MKKLDESDVNRHRSRNNINHFAPLYESDDNEDTRHGTKPKIQIIVPRKKQRGSKNKKGQNECDEEDGNES